MIQAEMSGEYRGAGRNHLINNDNNDHYHFNDIHASKCLISQNTLASFTGNDIQSMFKLSKDTVFQIDLTISSTVANTLLEAVCYLKPFNYRTATNNDLFEILLISFYH